MNSSFLEKYKYICIVFTNYCICKQFSKLQSMHAVVITDCLKQVKLYICKIALLLFCSSCMVSASYLKLHILILIVNACICLYLCK